MIEFHFKSDFTIHETTKYSDWVDRIVASEDYNVGQIDYIFCTDEFLEGINREYLNHDTLTDIITFDYTTNDLISGDIFISTERVADNADTYEEGFDKELLRVMSHGILHLVGYGDKTEEERAEMRNKEEEKIKMFHVEQ